MAFFHARALTYLYTGRAAAYRPADLYAYVIAIHNIQSALHIFPNDLTLRAFALFKLCQKLRLPSFVPYGRRARLARLARLTQVV